jgi:hypothetical protein
MTPAQLALAVRRSEALQHFYAAERRAGADPLTANERMHEFAKRLDEPAIARIMELSS